MYTVQWLVVGDNGMRQTCCRVLPDLPSAMAFYTEKAAQFSDARLRLVVELQGQGYYQGRAIENQWKKIDPDR